MKTENSSTILFLLYMIITLVLAAAYFSAPERALFFENQITWWKEFTVLL